MSRSGFVFSLDSIIAISLIVSAAFLFVSLEQTTALSSAQTTTVADDTLFSLENTGYIIQTIDTNTLANSATLIRQQLLNYLPNNFDANVSVTAYTIDLAQCPVSQDFSTCFPDANKSTASVGGSTLEPLTSGKKFYLRQEAPGDCNVSFIEFAGQKEFPINWEPTPVQEGALFSEAFFAEGDLNVSFDVQITPSTGVVCDQDVQVQLTITLLEALRKPVDLAIVLDRSGSMSWGGRVDTTDADHVWVDGNIAYIEDGSSGLRSIEVSNPLLPILLDRADPGNTNDVYGEGSYVFVTETSSTDQVVVYDVSDVNNLLELDRENFQSLYGLFVLDDNVYIAGDDSGGGRGLWILDATNKNNLTPRDNVDLSNADDIFVRDSIAYVARRGSGLSTVDVSDPDNISILDTLDPGGSSEGVFVFGSYAFLAIGSSGVAAIDITDPNNLILADTYNTPDDAENLYVDNNVLYAADDSSLQILDVSDPNNISFINSFATPYDYGDVAYQDGFAYMAASSIGLVPIDVSVGPRIDNAQEAAKQFVDFNGWSLPPDQMGVVSFNTSGTLDQGLTSVILDINNAIDSIVASGGTNIESGIDRAVTELTGANANPLALKFQILLSDGQSTSGDSAQAALDANALGITIFTVGFGADADEAELTTIATNSGGEYYSALDQNALIAVFELIAIKVGELASDSNISIPVIDGSTIIDLGGGIVVDNNLVFDAGEITISNPWSATYTLNFPCDNLDICGVDALTFPGPGTTFSTCTSREISLFPITSPEVISTFKSRELRSTVTDALKSMLWNNPFESV